MSVSSVDRSIQAAVESAVQEVAQRAPTSWTAGVSYYLDTMESAEASRFGRPNEALSDIRTNLRAIDRVRAALGKLPAVPPEVSMALEQPGNGDEKHVILASVMTPPGWEREMLPALERLRRSIFDVFKSGPRPTSFAAPAPEPETGKKRKAAKPQEPDLRSDLDLCAEYRVYDQLIRFLRETARAGEDARRRLNQARRDEVRKHG